MHRCVRLLHKKGSLIPIQQKKMQITSEKEEGGKVKKLNEATSLNYTQVGNTKNTQKPLKEYNLRALLEYFNHSS